jgi:hypothetical protein
VSGRNSPETAQAIEKMREGLDGRHRRRVLSFQLFVTTLLIVLVIITTTTFIYTMRSERAAFEASEARAVVFREHVREILDTIVESQEQAHQERLLLQQHVTDLIEQHEHSP